MHSQPTNIKTGRGAFAIMAAIMVSSFHTGSAAPAKSPQSPPAPRELAIKMGALFHDNAILQREMKLPIWGWSKPGATVTVAFSGQKKNTTAGVDGKWMLKLDPLQANARPQAMVVSDSSGKTETLNNILVGEVWLCSGQSNMDWKLKQLGGRYDQDIARANDPKLRLCVVRDIYAAAPQQRHASTWEVCTPDQAREFSAVAFFFGAKLLQELDVPIGLIESARGGSPVEAWMSEQTLRQGFPEFNAKLDTFPAIVQKTGGVFAHRKQSKVFGITQTTPAVLYNGYIHPLIPFAIRGAIWYQGESNVKRPEQYRKLFPAMIRQWRADWNQGDFPFYYVQIAPCGYKDLSAAYLREAQMMALSVPHTGMAVTMDLGDEKNIHPPEKKPVGERLARIALARDYGRKNLVYSGPVIQQSRIEKSSIRLSFDHVGGGLASRDGKPLSHFTIAGKDQQFVDATAVIDGKTIVVSSPTVTNPVAVRYAWGSADIPNLINKEGLPASSFRTDLNSKF